MASEAIARRGDTLVMTGVLDRAAVPALWQQALPLLAGTRCIDLAGTTQVDSAGLALLAEVCARLRPYGPVTLAGVSPELAELRDAYRLGADLDFQASPTTPLT